MANAYDVIIIGSGPGGYVTAIRAAQLGLKTAIVEREHLGGICLNWGCIPTKALLRSAEILDHANHAKAYGLTLNGTMTADVKDVVARSRGVSARLNGGVAFLMKKNKVTVIDGVAKLTGATSVTVTKDGAKVGDYAAKHVILALGARADSGLVRHGAARGGLLLVIGRRHPSIHPSAKPGRCPGHMV